MKTQAVREEWNRLIWALGDGEISPEDKERLEVFLRDEPEARELYVRNMAMEALLQWETSPAEWVEEKPVEIGGPLLVFDRWFGGLGRLAAAAALVFGIGLASYFALRNTEPAPVVAEPTTGGVQDKLIIRGVENEGSNPLIALLKEKPEITEIGEVDDLTITAETNPQGQLVQRIYLEVPAVLPPPSHGRIVEETVAGFDENQLLDKAALAIEALENGQKVATEGRIETHGEFADWRGEDPLLTLTDQGIKPHEGSDMVKFPVAVSSSGNLAESTEILRVIDVRSLGDEISKRKVTARSSAHFNQAVGLADDGTSYALRMHAIAREDGENRALGREVAQLVADTDPVTWERADGEINLPAGTDYLVVSVSVRKEGSPQALLASLGGSYADAVNVSMQVDGRPVYGRL